MVRTLIGNNNCFGCLWENFQSKAKGKHQKEPQKHQQQDLEINLKKALEASAHLKRLGIASKGIILFDSTCRYRNQDFVNKQDCIKDKWLNHQLLFLTWTLGLPISVLRKENPHVLVSKNKTCELVFVLCQGRTKGSTQFKHVEHKRN